MFRPFRNPGQNAAPLGPAQLQAMNQANQLVARGQPILAAPIFAQLASNLETSNHPRRAANLHAQAAHAFADGQDERDALVQAPRLESFHPISDGQPDAGLLCQYHPQVHQQRHEELGRSAGERIRPGRWRHAHARTGGCHARQPPNQLPQVRRTAACK